MRRWALGLVCAACGGPSEAPPPPDQAPADTDGVPPVDLDPPTPTPTPTPAPEETGLVRDTAPVPVVVPTALGGGFFDLLAPRWAEPVWSVPSSSVPGGRTRPDEAWAVSGDLLGDASPELVAAGVVSADDAAPRQYGQVFAAGPAGWAWDAAASAAVARQYAGGVVAVVDLDGDGDADVLKSNVERGVGLREGTGWRWVSLPLPPGRTSVTGLTAPALADLDLDGWLDLVFGTDDCGLSGDPAHLSVVPWLRTGAETWSPRPDLVPQSPAGDPYAVLVAPLGPADVPHLITLGRACQSFDPLPSFFVQTGRDPEGWPVWAGTDPLPPDALFRLDPGNLHRTLAREQPMGGAVLDLDGDARLDLVVSLSHALLHVFGGTAGPQMEDRTWGMQVGHPIGASGVGQLPWAVAPLDVDADGFPDLTIAMGDDFDSTFAEPWNGPYPVVTWWNDGRGGLHDVSTLTGMDRQGSWHALAVADVDGDAAPDLLAGGQGTLPAVWRNEVGLGAYVALRLRGSTSNGLGLGAIVTVEGAGLPRQTRVAGGAGSMHVADVGELFFGVGSAPAVRATVRWPSGVVQVLEGLTPGWHTVAEPPLITLSEVDRHLPADGLTSLEIVVTPTDPSGAPRAATVTIEAPYGPASFAGPVVADGAAWRRALVAPETPSSSVIEVTIDGVVVPVHPRVWWDAP